MKVLPQVAFGGGWYTALYFYDSTLSFVNVGLKLFNGDGTPLTIPGVGGNATTLSLAGNGTTILEFLNVGSLQQGWAQLTLPTGVISYGIFRQSVPGQQDQEGSVETASVSSSNSLMIYDNTAFATGIAFVNPGSSTETVTVTATDASGNTIGTTTVSLPPLGKTVANLVNINGLGNACRQARGADDQFSRGVVAVTAQRFNGGAFSSIPITQN